MLRFKLILIYDALFLITFTVIILNNREIEEIQDDIGVIGVDGRSQLLWNVRQHGLYWVIHNYILSSENPIDNESVTFATYGSCNNLKLLPTLLNRWNAPISLSIYASGSDFKCAIDSLIYINSCFNSSDLFNRFLRVHIIMHNGQIPDSLLRFNKSQRTSCEPGFPHSGYNIQFPHPINLMKNVARQHASTHYVMTVDPDLIPSAEFSGKFLNFAEIYALDSYSTVFCLPIFPIQNAFHQHPSTKRELRHMLTVTKFTSNTNKIYYNRIKWLNKACNIDNNITIFTRTHNFFWDLCGAYIIINELEPLSDETEASVLKPWGSKKLDYTFVILDNAFVLQPRSKTNKMKREFNLRNIST